MFLVAALLVVLPFAVMVGALVWRGSGRNLPPTRRKS